MKYKKKKHFDEGHSALVQKITRQSHAISVPSRQVKAFYDQCALRYDTPKLGVFNRRVTT